MRLRQIAGIPEVQKQIVRRHGGCEGNVEFVAMLCGELDCIAQCEGIAAEVDVTPYYRGIDHTGIRDDLDHYLVDIRPAHVVVIESLENHVFARFGLLQLERAGHDWVLGHFLDELVPIAALFGGLVQRLKQMLRQLEPAVVMRIDRRTEESAGIRLVEIDLERVAVDDLGFLDVCLEVVGRDRRRNPA